MFIGGWAVADGFAEFKARAAELLGGSAYDKFVEEPRHGMPWVSAFIAGGPFRAIASLEMLATLAAMVVLELEATAYGAIKCSAANDKLENVCVTKRFLTTEFPSSR